MGLLKRLRCPHSNLVGIFGDNINAAGGKRLRCLSCGSFLDGPVILAEIRKEEVGWAQNE